MLELAASPTRLACEVMFVAGRVAEPAAFPAERRPRRTDGAELQATLVASASLMSQLVWDASARRDGVTTLDYCDQAIAAAEASQQPAAKANAQLRRSYVALYVLSGSCYLFLGSPERAEPISSDTVQSLGSWQKTRSLVLGNLALAYIRQRKLEQATATLHDAIDALEQTRGAGGLAVVFGAARELYPWHL